MASVQFKTMQQMVADLYPSADWKDRVYNHMSHEQVCAIYHKSLERGYFDKKKKKPIAEHWRQMTIFDLFKKEDK